MKNQFYAYHKSLDWYLTNLLCVDLYRSLDNGKSCTNSVTIFILIFPLASQAVYGIQIGNSLILSLGIGNNCVCLCDSTTARAAEAGGGWVGGGTGRVGSRRPSTTTYYVHPLYSPTFRFYQKPTQQAGEGQRNHQQATKTHDRSRPSLNHFSRSFYILARLACRLESPTSIFSPGANTR